MNAIQKLYYGLQMRRNPLLVCMTARLACDDDVTIDARREVLFAYVPSKHPEHVAFTYGNPDSTFYLVEREWLFTGLIHNERSGSLYIKPNPLDAHQVVVTIRYADGYHHLYLDRQTLRHFLSATVRRYPRPPSARTERSEVYGNFYL